MATPPTLSTPRLSYPWTFSLAKALENSIGPLPDPVATQGAELVPPPETPALRYPPTDPTFVETLTKRLERLVWRQEIRINIYGVDFAEEWPISRTPRLLADEAAAQRIAFLQKDMHLDSSSTSESEGEDERRILRLKKMLRRSRKQPRPSDVQLPSPQSTTEEEAGGQPPAPMPSLKRKRSSIPFESKKVVRTSKELSPVAENTLPLGEGWPDAPMPEHEGRRCKRRNTDAPQPSPMLRTP